MKRRYLLLAMLALMPATGSDAAVRGVQATASPVEGLNTRIAVTIFIDRPGETVDLKLLAMPEGAAESQLACWRATDAAIPLATGACQPLPDGELEKGTIVVEILRSLPLARYRIEVVGEDQHPHTSPPFDTRTFPVKLVPGLAPAGPPVLFTAMRLDPENVAGVSGIRFHEIAARAEGLTISITDLYPSKASEGFVFELLGPSGLAWSKLSTESTVTYDGPKLAPGDYVWMVRSQDPETILALPELPRFSVDEQRPR
ncbi:MAG: hypothetical protein HC897_06690 [Thermoanaerobaculia bacterium]|nr:hypothetical protein [Thermoanaerobaculia bacterium]